MDLTSDRPDDLITPEPYKLYCVVREDLPPGLRAAQAGHAIANLCAFYPHMTKQWRQGGNYLIVLGVPNEPTLMNWWADIKSWGIAREIFHEPDLGLQATAMAAFPPPHMNHVFSPLPLAYSPPRWRRRLSRLKRRLSIW